MSDTGQVPGEAARRLNEAGSVTVLTGAGVSAESGIPTFRGADGLWQEYRAQDLATPQAFARDPQLVWEWYHWRRRLVSEASANLAHKAIAGIEDRADAFTLVTQNVDGLHRAAGSRNILEIHGNLNRARCLNCGHREHLDRQEGIPRCGSCQGVMRPDVVWFGESLDRQTLEAAFTAAASAQVFIVAGTSNVVQPAASLAFAAADRGGYVLEINLEPTPLTGTADATVLGPAGELLPQLVEMAWS